jgi:hypothetical protein
MIASKPRKMLFLLFALSLSVTTFGQTSKETCSKTLPCEVLDIAQAKIEKGSICEQQRKIDSTTIKDQQAIIRNHERTIAEKEQIIRDKEDKEVKLNTTITALEDKVRKRGRQRFTWSAIATALAKISNYF